MELNSRWMYKTCKLCHNKQIRVLRCITNSTSNTCRWRRFLITTQQFSIGFMSGLKGGQGRVVMAFFCLQDLTILVVCTEAPSSWKTALSEKNNRPQILLEHLQILFRCTVVIYEAESTHTVSRDAPPDHDFEPRSYRIFFFTIQVRSVPFTFTFSRRKHDDYLQFSSYSRH